MHVGLKLETESAVLSVFFRSHMSLVAVKKQYNFQMSGIFKIILSAVYACLGLHVDFGI